MWKKILPLLLTLCLFSPLALALAENGQESPKIQVTIDGVEVEFDTAPILVNDRTMVPMRAVFEAMGMDVEWDGETQTVTATGSDVTILTTVGETDVVKRTADGEEIFSADQAPLIRSDRTLVPVRFISEALGAHVDWNLPSRTVVITTDSPKEGIKRLYYGDGQTVLYQGEVENDLPNGKGTYYYENGTVLCIGEFSNGEMNGFCTVYGTDFVKSGIYSHGDLVEE